MSRKNPTSPLRSGFDYQDLYSIYLCIEWFKDPLKYKWMKFETIPDEINDNNFFLDDIIFACEKEGYEMYQVKHKQNPDTDKWDWDSLLKQEKKRNGDLKDSLLQKWYNSYFKPELENKVGYASFITNGLPDDDIKSCLSGNNINLEQVKDEYLEVFSIIVEQLGNEGKIQKFFNEFHFVFGQKELNEIENDIRKVFYDDLRATENGVTNLLLQIHKEGSKRYTDAITLEMLKTWCEWDNPRPLNQGFQIPGDFVMFDENIHKDVMSDLNNSEGGVKVIIGKPGSGKSTYLSKLYETLSQQKKVVIRHHYHISTQEDSAFERLNSERVIESIKFELKNFKIYLDDLANKNSKRVSLHEYINTLSRSLYKKSDALILIIDGLDHVLRYSDQNELENFLKEVCLTQKGLWIVIGTQNIAKQYLPQAIFDYCPENKWIEIKGINKESVNLIFNKNIINLNLPESKDQRKEIANKLYEISNGNPLHLHYSLNQLKNQLNSKVINIYDLNDIPPYDQEIEKYYGVLWRKIPDIGKMLSYILALIDFKLTRDQVIEIMTEFENNLTTVLSGTKSVSHLLVEDFRGLAIYHNSFKLFLLDQKEYRMLDNPIKKKIINWLEQSENDELKWAHLKKLYYEIGNPEPILELDKNWVIDSLSNARDPKQVTLQLDIAAKAAFENRLFGKVFHLSKLNQYYSNSIDFVEDGNDRIWEEALRLNNNKNLITYNLEQYSTHKIFIIGLCAEKQGNFRVLNEAIEALNARHNEKSIVSKGEIGGNIPSLAKYIITLVSLDRTHDVMRIYNYICQYSDVGWTDELFDIYVSLLINTRQFSKLNELLKIEFKNEEKTTILNCISIKCFEFDNDDIKHVIRQEKQENLSNFRLLHLALSGDEIGKLPDLPDYESFPRYVKEYESGKRIIRSQLFTQNFVLGILYGYLETEEVIKDWIRQADDRWTLKIMGNLFESSLEIAKNIKRNEVISYSNVFKNLESVIELTFPENRNLLEMQFSLRIALADIIKLISLFKSRYNKNILLTEEELISIASSRHFNDSVLLHLLIDIGKPLLSNEAYRRFIDDQKTYWVNNITDFPTRTEQYADLAKLAAIHGDSSNQILFLNLASSNILGYGYHKDMNLYELLKSIEVVHNFCPEEVLVWVKRISPLVENIGEYTDGDETNHFPRFLAEILTSIDKDLLFKYYYAKASGEELFLAEDTFKYIVKSMDFIKEEGKILATTALDKASYAELVDRAKENKMAEKALLMINNYYGEINFNDEKDYSSSISNSNEELQDVRNIIPDNLKEHLDKINTQWDAKRFLNIWAKEWVNHHDIDKTKLYGKINEIIQSQGLHNVDSELLDLLFPLAYEFDNVNAFEYLCWAQANDNGWEYFWNSKEKSLKRWDIVKELYSDRYIEFFEKSVTRTNNRFGKGNKYFINIPRSLEFFILFNKMEIAKEVVESAVTFAETLMANLELPPSNWVDHTNIDELDILIQRLTWPSPLVRERASSGIAYLITESNHQDIIFEKLLSWINRQKLESIVSIGLLTLIKAAYIGGEDFLSKYQDKIVNAIPMTSIVIKKLLEELFNNLGINIHIGNKNVSINIPSKNYQTNKFFIKHITGFLAPIYFQNAELISKNTGFDFVKQWSFTSAELIDECNIVEQVGDAMYFMGGRNDPIMSGMSTLLSEVYRTAYLRILQYLFDNNLIPIDVFLEFSYSTLPVELSFWKIAPGRSPEWWPMFKQLDTEKTSLLDTTKAGLTENINVIIEKEDEFKLLALEGAIKPSDGWKAKVDSSISLIGFAYQVMGSDIPSPEEVASMLLFNNIEELIPIAKRPFNMLESQEFLYSIVDEIPFTIRDLVIHPIVCRYKDLVIPLWQWYRMHSLSFGLTSELANQLEVNIVKSGIDFVAGSNLIASQREWLEGLEERFDNDLTIPYGQYLQIDSQALHSLLEESNLRLGYVLKTTCRNKKYIYEEVEEFVDYKLIGVSKIIL